MANELNPGRYPATLRDSKLEWLGQNGTPCLKVYGTLDANGLETEAIIWLSEGAAHIARQQLRAIGFDPDTEDVALLDETGRLNGLRAEFTLKYKEYRGNLQEQWGVATPRPDTSGINALLRGAGSAASKERAAAPRAPAAPASPPARPSAPAPGNPFANQKPQPGGASPFDDVPF